MTGTAISRGWRKAVRTIAQMALGGSLTAVVDLLAHGLSATAAGGIMIAWTAVISFFHNYAETAGKIPVLLSTPGLVTSTVAPVAQATVEAEASATGAVVGVVTATTGEVIGEVTGQAQDAPTSPPPPIPPTSPL